MGMRVLIDTSGDIQSHPISFKVRVALEKQQAVR